MRKQKTGVNHWNRTFLALLTALLFSGLATPACGDRVTIHGGGPAGWQGWKCIGAAFKPTRRERAVDPFPSVAHMECGESETGTLRSPPFVIKGDVLRFWVNGWDGQSGGANLNGFVLRLAADDRILRTARPPQQDSFNACAWLVGDLKGKQAYFEAFDNNRSSGFAWVGIACLEEVIKDIPAAASIYHALPFPPSLGIWAVINYDGARRKTNPYLSSLERGEQATGRVRSPDFIIKSDRIRFSLRGWDGRDGRQSGSRIELVDAKAGHVLRISFPPLGDWPVQSEWNVGELLGRKVFLRLIDSNANMSFAWLGLDEVDAGPGYTARFAGGGTAGWHAEGAGRTYLDCAGIPFLAEAFSPVSERKPFSLRLGFEASRLFLLGMTHSLDQGCAGWGDPTDSRSRFFVGDRIGRVNVKYADGKVEVYPLVLGESAWWGKRFFANPEPFASDRKARQALAESLRLYPARPVPDGRYLAVIRLRPAAVSYVEIAGTAAKAGAPVLVGLTAESAQGDKAGIGTALPHATPSRDVLDFINSKPLLKQGSRGQTVQARLSRLRNALYTTVENFPKRVPLDLPRHYVGPRVRFEGDVDAEILTNIFHHNLHDIAAKVDANGMYHTSTKNAPTWGEYNGFGTFRKNHGAYYPHTWSRDMGRSLGELVAFGRLDKARLCSDYVFKMARLWETGVSPDGADLIYKGRRLPRHICRIINLPNTTPGEGCFENDGHGLTGLFVYQTWRRLEDRDEWLRTHWQDVRGLGDWVKWQLDNPEISGATQVLLTDSECAGGIGHSVYADMACMEALRGLADMADSIGEAQTAAEWRQTAERLRKGIQNNYVVKEDTYGPAWTLVSAGWPNRSTVLGPILFLPDRRGFLPEDDDLSWRPLTEAAYRRLTGSYKPLGFYGVAMGYGQGFVTQAALLLDRMKEATEMLRWAARATYCAHFQPYIVPEGCETESSGRFWHRTGDLGNGVQEAEIVKAIRLVIGIDDTWGHPLRIVPRLPYGWTRIAVDSYPALIAVGKSTSVASINYELTRNHGGMRLRLRSDEPLGLVDLRLGPFESAPDKRRVTLNGRPARAQLARSGDSWWVRLTAPGGRALDVKVR
jgi:hypothetical protein